MPALGKLPSAAFERSPRVSFSRLYVTCNQQNAEQPVGVRNCAVITSIKVAFDRCSIVSRGNGLVAPFAPRHAEDLLDICVLLIDGGKSLFEQQRLPPIYGCDRATLIQTR